MANKTPPLSREAGVKTLIQQAPIAPDEHSHTYDDDIAILWRVGEQIIHLRLDPAATQGRWLSWHPAEYSDTKNTFQYLDITKLETWIPLFSELQC